MSAPSDFSRAGELVCPAGTPAALRTAVDAGADSVYCGFRNATNARNFPGLNFTPEELGGGGGLCPPQRGAGAAGAQHLSARRADGAVARGGGARRPRSVSTPSSWPTWAWPGTSPRTHPDARLHLSVQAAASSPEAIRYYCAHFGVRRVVLPRILTIPEIRQIKREIPCEIETFIFGNHGLMVEGRCSLTNWLTGQSTNMDGVCSPAADVTYERDADGIDAELPRRLHHRPLRARTRTAGYPTICKGRYAAPHRPEGYYAFEEPVSLNLGRLLPGADGRGRPRLQDRGAPALQEPTCAQVVSAFRRAVDDIRAGARSRTWPTWSR